MKQSQRPRSVAILVFAGFTLGVISSGGAQPRAVSSDFEVLWVKQQPHAFAIVEEKAALHPDGTAVAYFAPNGDLVIADITTGKETVLVPRLPYMDDAAGLAFSPDGKRVAFWRSDVTGGCPASNIYAVDTDGQNLTQLTHTTPISADFAELIRNSRPACQRRYWRPKYSPDGSKILLCVTEAVARQNPETKEYYGTNQIGVAVMAPDGSGLEVLAMGHFSCLRSFWSLDGKSIYYSAPGEEHLVLVRMDVATRTTQDIKGDRRGLLGPRPDREWVAKHSGIGAIGWYSVENGEFDFVGMWSVPGEKQVGDKNFQLHGFDWSPSGAVLLWYDDGSSERFEVLRFSDGDLIGPPESPTH